MTMGEYEDRYPDAFGRGKEIDPEPKHDRLPGVGLPDQVRDDQVRGDGPAVAESPEEAAPVPAAIPAEPSKPAAPLPGPERGQERPRRVFIERVPGDVQRDVQERLNDSPFVDAS